MFQGNAGLKPKEGEITSRPWQWPINFRVIIIIASELRFSAEFLILENDAIAQNLITDSY